MAAQGEKILYSELLNWYEVFNNLATNYSENVTALSIPVSGKKAEPSDINKLHEKINQFRSDTYLGTKAAWFPVGTNVSKNEYIRAIDPTAILGVVSNAALVKCRNVATNTCGVHGSGSLSHGDKGCGLWGNVQKQNGSRSHGDWHNEGNTDGWYSHLKRTHGWYQSSTRTCGVYTCGTNNHTNKSNTTVIDITCVHSTKVNQA